MAKERVFNIEGWIVAAALILVVGVSIPAYKRYRFDSFEHEGLRILLAAYQEQLRVRNATGNLTEAQGRCEDKELCPYIQVQIHSDPRFNLITGRFAQIPTPFESTTSWHQIDESRMEPLNSFGVALNPINRQKELFLIGVEANLDDDDFVHVLAINERGNVFRICNDWTNEASDPNQTLYKAYSKKSDPPNCRRSDD